MDELKCKIFKTKSLELLNLFYFHNDYKYKFRPEKFNELISSKEKLNAFSPKSCKFFKKIVKFRSNKNKKLLRQTINSNEYDFKNFKKIQDEQNVNDALQEATVLDKISLLKKNGTWSREALPKLMEPSRCKVHWDYLIDEVEWLAIDMKNRFNWKILAAKIIAESAKNYVFVKEEIKSLEFIQMQEEARLNCSSIANMIKEWWQEKRTSDIFESINCKTEACFSDYGTDFCQVWLSNNLINAESQGEKLDSLYDKSDSDSLCSFDSSQSHCSIMLNDEEHIYANDESSFDMSDNNSHISNLIDELNWLENDMELNDTEMKFSFENEINELKILSQTPLEYIIDENYFLNTDLVDTKSINSSDSFDTESLLSDVLSHETNDIYNKTETTLPSCIVSRSEKIQELLSTMIFSEPLSVSSFRTLEELLKYDVVNRNMQIILELVKQKYSFSIVSSLQCGDDKFIISTLLAYLSHKFHLKKPELIVTTRPQIYEWQSLLAKICPDCKIIVFDSYLSLESATKILENVDNSTLVICIISYAALSTQFCVTSVTWHNIIYDQVEKLCENSSNIPDKFFLPDANLIGVRIGLISEDSNFPMKNHCINSFFRLLYSSLELDELLNELQCSDVAKYSLKCYEKLKTIVQNHCVPLQRIYDPGTSFQVVMCELTPFQQTLHQCVVNKLKKSLESNNLLDIVEAVCQDLQLSQHPFCFEHSSDVEAELFSTFRSQYVYSNPIPTYYLSKNDTLSFYVPKKILSVLSLNGMRFSKIANDNALLYNLCDLATIGLTKYERVRVKDLLISTSNVDYLLNKIPACLSDTDDEYNQSTNANEFINDNANHLVEQDEFLSGVDLENLRFEWNNFNENEVKNFKGPSFVISESKHDNDNCEKDLQMSSTLAARRSKTKFKSRLTSLSKENEKYCLFLHCSEYGYLIKNKIVPVDLNVRMSELNCLEHLYSISTQYIDTMTDRYSIVQNKVISRSPKLLPVNKSELLLKTYNHQLVQSITELFQTLLPKHRRANTKLHPMKKDEINLSGKLRTLNSILIGMANDSSIKTCVILSHSFELLNLIEALIFINHNYGAFVKFRLNSYCKENDEKLFSIIEKFNKYQSRNKKSILLIHTRTNYQLLQHIGVDSCSIIIADSHWQTDSDQLVFKMINRWGVNNMLSRGNGILSIYKLCTFESLEQYFLTNDLSFLYDNSYRDKRGLVTTTSAVVSQQSLLKHFVDKLLSPLKEELVSGFCVDDFQPALQKKGNLLKLSDESIVDIFNSFENAYDLLQLCNYRCARNVLSREFTHLAEISHGIMSGHGFPQIQFEDSSTKNDDLREILRRRENYRIKRQSKLSHILDFAKDQDSLLFYDPKQLQLQDVGVWMPPLIDDSIKYVQTEILDDYDLNPIRDTELSIHLVPVKSYPTKSNRKWDDKTPNSNVLVKEDSALTTPDYSDIDRMKKRKLSNDYQVGEYSQYCLNQKKRKIFTNRRYYTENETDMTAAGQSNLKARYKIEKKISNETEMQNIDIKEVLDIKKQSPIVGEQPSGDVNSHSLINQSTIQNQTNLTQPFDGKSNSILLCTNDNVMKINLQRPFYSKEGLRTLKIKRQQISTGNMSNVPPKTNMITGSNTQNYPPQQRPSHNHRGQIFHNTKLGSNSDITPQSNGESEYEKLPEWNIHEEAVLYQNISHYQDHPFSINTFEKLLPNFKICEHYLNFYFITNTHRSSDMCKIHFTKLQMGFLNQNKGDNNLTRLNRQSNILNPSGVPGIRSINETRPVIGGVTGRKLKIKMKNSIGTYGTSIFGSTQAMTNKIKMFQCFLNDMKVNLMQTNQIVNSCLNSFDSRTTMTFKMLDEVVNTSKLPSFLPNHSQTIKKNATHISALEEHNIHPDKIFTPAMLIQRREEMDKDRESESTIINTNPNRQQIVTSVSSSSYRNVNYFETNPINSSTHSLNHIRRTTSTNIGSGQNLYSLQTPSNNQVVSRARYNLPINRQMTGGATVIHQQNTNQIQSSTSSMTSNITSSSNSAVPQNQATSLGSRSQSVQFQIQHTRNASSMPRRTSSQQVFQRLVYPTNYQSLRQNQLMNRGSTAFVRPIIPTVNQSNSQNTTTNSIISVFPNTLDQSNSGISRSLDRGVNFNITNQIRGHNVRTNIATVSSSNRSNLNQIPRMLHVNQINRNNMNVNNINRNQEQ